MNAGCVDLRLLGHFQLLMDGKPVDGLNQARLQLLLAYVTLHRNLVLSASRSHSSSGLIHRKSKRSPTCANCSNLLRQAVPRNRPLSSAHGRDGGVAQ